MTRTGNWTLVCLLAFPAIPVTSGADTLFDGHDILEVVIEAPLTTFMKERSDVDYLDGTFSVTDEAGEAVTFDLKLRARGRYRLQKRTCNFPPARLNFRKGQLAASILEGQDKLKLVTHCQNRRSKNEQYVLREYLAYRIFQVLTDRSFRVRLMRIRYVNSEKSEDPMMKYGFVIEDDESVASRLGLSITKTPSLTYEELDPGQANLVNVFQYLIGNTDYSIVLGPADDDCCHNSIPFSDGVNIVPIPYDFDFAGLVDTPYADPNPRFKIRDVRTRLYRGLCDNNEHLPDSIRHIVAKKEEIYALVDELQGFDRRSRQSVTRYLNEFFADIEDERTVERKLLKECS